MISSVVSTRCSTRSTVRRSLSLSWTSCSYSSKVCYADTSRELADRSEPPLAMAARDRESALSIHVDLLSRGSQTDDIGFWMSAIKQLVMRLWHWCSGNWFGKGIVLEDVSLAHAWTIRWSFFLHFEIDFTSTWSFQKQKKVGYPLALYMSLRRVIQFYLVHAHERILYKDR